MAENDAHIGAPREGDIAIVGIGCRFPGGADSPEAFWRLLLEGRSTVTEVPAWRWDLGAHYHPDRARPGKIYARHGSFLEHVSRFDAEFFGISPREASRIDPQQRLLLMVAWEAMEDAGIVPSSLTGTRAGVFIGISSNEYGELQQQDPESVNAYTGTGNDLSVAANRLSYFFDLHGPSLSISTACSSSLSALHVACEAMRQGGMPVAFVGGTNLVLTPSRTLQYAKASMLSEAGRCFSFDERASGYVRGEGVGLVVLKPLAAAVADGNSIHAVIRATGVNQDGRTTGLSLPNAEAQAALLRDVYARAGIDPREAQYVEAHGTGTKVGDPIECRALASVLGAGRDSDDRCRIGSVKTNIGHLESAAGIAGIIKVALALGRGYLPGNVDFSAPNPEIDFAASHLEVQRGGSPWPKGATGAVAGVNSFGFGGSNAHAVLQGYVGPMPEPSARPDDAGQLLVASGRTPAALRELASAYRTRLAADEVPPLADLCFSAAVHREHHPERLAIAATSREELADHLDAFLAGESRVGTSARRAAANPPKVAFVFAGNGPQWHAMGRQLLRSEPVFRQAVEACDRELRRYADWSLLDELAAGEEASRMGETAVAQPALFAIQMGLVALWRSWGVAPAAVIGHSVGEIAAAATAGVLSLEGAIRVIFHRSRTQEETAGMGRMAAADIDEARARDLAAQYGGRLHVAAVNAPGSVTLSGDTDAVEDAVRTLHDEQVACRVLRLNYAFHSHHLDPVREDLLGSLEGLRPSAARVPFASAVRGALVEGTECDARYWWDNIRSPVRFHEAVDLLLADGFATFLEIGPHPVLGGYLAAAASARETSVQVLPSLRRREDERISVLGSLGALYAAGCRIEWRGLWPSGRFVPLPLYPWAVEEYWNAPRRRTAGAGPLVHPLLGARLDTARPVWTAELDPRSLPYLEDHRVGGSRVVPGTAAVEIALAAVREARGDAPCSIERLGVHEALFISEERTPCLQAGIDDDSTLTVFSRYAGDDEAWRTFATAHVRTLSGHTAQPSRLDLAAVRDRCARELSGAGLNELGAARGLDYGPAFQGAQRIWVGTAEALGEVRTVEAVAVDAQEYRVHPAVLDACFQVTLALLPTLGDPGEPLATQPVAVTEIHSIVLHRPMPDRVCSHVRVVDHRADQVVVDVAVTDETGDAVVTVQGLRLQAVAIGGESARGIDDLLYESIWQESPLERTVTTPDEGAVTPLADCEPELARLVAEAGDRREVIAYHAEVAPCLTRVAAAYVLEALAARGWTPTVGDTFSSGELRRRTDIADFEAPVLTGLLDLLAHQGVLSGGDDDRWRVEASPGPADVDADGLWRDAVNRYPDHMGELAAIASVGPRVRDALGGDFSGVPEALDDASQDRWTGPSAAIRAQLVAALARTLTGGWSGGRPPRVLEVGGADAANALLTSPDAAERIDWWVTARSSAELARLEHRGDGRTTTRVFDVGGDPAEQGLADERFDLVILERGDDVPCSDTTAAHLWSLLAPGGIVVSIESSPVGWVRLLRACRAGYLLTAAAPPADPSARWDEEWRRLGAADVVALPGTAADGAGSFLVTVAQRAPELDAVPTVQPRRAGPAWVLLSDGGEFSARLAERLETIGRQVVRVLAGEGFRQEGPSFTVDPGRREHFAQVFERVRADHGRIAGVVHAWGVGLVDEAAWPADRLGQAQALTCGSAIHAVQALTTVWSGSAPRLWLLTGGAQADVPAAAGIAQAPLWGLGRVVMSELPDVRCTLVDLEPGDLGRSPLASRVADELVEDGPEQELRLSAGSRQVGRLVHTRLGHAEAPVDALGDDTFTLTIPTPGTLDGLAYAATPRGPLADDQVEIEVVAGGLNFKDVLQALGVIQGEALEQGWMGGLSLGFECAGRVTRVGPAVTGVRVGDDVIACARDAFGGHAVTPERFVVRKPGSLDFAEAATLPIAFLTAVHALEQVARLRAGERILIHGGAGGVGLCAIQVAQRLGAEVFATAGTPEKRDFLRAYGVPHVLDSRSLSFADEVERLTDGEGVDVVLNSLSGEALLRSVGLLRPFGRFLEIGKRDVLGNTRLGLSALERCVSFHVIDLDQLMLHDPQTVRSMLTAIVEDVEAGTLSALPHRVFTRDRVVEAFRYMQQSRHIGKVVLDLSTADIAVRKREEPFRCAEDGTYVIAGGLGGFGLALSRWLVSAGARSLALLSRRGVESRDARREIAALKRMGAEVTVHRADITSADDVKALFDELHATRPPVRGIVQSAMVLDDGILMHMDMHRFRRAADVKILGTWNLHQASLGLPLDFFVMFSSFSSLIGYPGQGNYCAGNAFQDRLAVYRRGRGLPALTVNWGVLGEVGYIARHEDVSASTTRRGAKAMPMERVLQVLDRLLTAERVQVGAVEMNWAEWAAAAGALPPRLAGLVDSAAQGDADASSESFGETLRAAPPAERLSLLETRVRTQVAAVLGVSPAKLDGERPVSMLGLDSLMAVELQIRLSGDLGGETPVMHLIESHSIPALAAALVERFDRGAADEGDAVSAGVTA